LWKEATTEVCPEVHARSAFSFLEGASLPEDLVDRAAELEISAVALLDRDCVSGAVRFHKQAEKRGIRALIGAEVTAPGGFRYPLLAETRTGYRNLCRLISRSKLEGRVEIAEHAEGLICLTGGAEGPLAYALVQGREEADRRIGELVEVFGPGNVYVELQRHHHRDQEARNAAAREIAARFRLPLLATNGVCHATSAERELMDALTCVRHKTTIQRAGRLLARNAERHLKPASEMERLFADVPQALANARELAGRIGFTLTDLGYRFPRYPVPEGETMNSFLRRRTEEGARRRYRPYHEKARRQIERELALIEKLDLEGYFLIVWDIVRVLPARAHPGAGPRVGRQFCGVLCAGNHGGRSGRDGTAVRAVPFRGARGMAGHRYRPAQRRRARARDPICLRALRQAGRGHDRQCHHVPRALGGARDRQGAGLRSRDVRRLSNLTGRGSGRIRRTKATPERSSARPGSTRTIR
jgi:hypothetical protein